MPTYDYKCKACGHTWELFQSMSAKPEKLCPSCGKKTAERLIGTGAALLFKGSGFYQTDYRSDSYKKAAEADKKSASGEPAKPEAKSQQKPDAKPADSKPAPEAKPKPEPKAPAAKGRKKGGQ